MQRSLGIDFSTDSSSISVKQTIEALMERMKPMVTETHIFEYRVL